MRMGIVFDSFLTQAVGVVAGRGGGALLLFTSFLYLASGQRRVTTVIQVSHAARSILPKASRGDGGKEGTRACGGDRAWIGHLPLPAFRLASYQKSVWFHDA
eukprot:COSAG01_NODE_5300_length_4351_cov_20.529163_4_plen_102_part_00